MENDLYEYLDKHLSLIPKTKDHCAGCEHLEVIRMLLPRLEELEKKILEMDIWIGECENSIDSKINIHRFEELEKKVAALGKTIIPLEFNQEIHAKIIHDLIKNLDAKPEI